MSDAIIQTPAPHKAAPPKGRKVARSGAEQRRHVIEVFVRTTAAVVGGYVTAGLATAVLARLTPGPTAEVTIAVTGLSFFIYVGVIVWAFADAKVRRVWAGLLGSWAIMAGVLWLSLQVEPRL